MESALEERSRDGDLNPGVSLTLNPGDRHGVVTGFCPLADLSIGGTHDGELARETGDAVNRTFSGIGAGDVEIARPIEEPGANRVNNPRRG